MKINYSKAYNALYQGEKLPRKVKKHLLGKRESAASLRRRLKNLVLINDIKTMYERPEYNIPLCCPKCGCMKSRGTGNMTSYPEHWEYFYCSRCNFKVGVIDNSPYIHCFDYKDNGFILSW